MPPTRYPPPGSSLPVDEPDPIDFDPEEEDGEEEEGDDGLDEEEERAESDSPATRAFAGPVPTATLQQLWTDVLDTYKVWSTLSGKAASTATRYVTAGRTFMEWSIKLGLAPDVLTEQHVSDFSAWADEKKMPKVTKHIAMIVARDLARRVYMTEPKKRTEDSVADTNGVAAVPGSNGTVAAAAAAPPPPAEPQRVVVEVATPRQRQTRNQQDDGNGTTPAWRGKRDPFARAMPLGATQMARFYKRVHGKRILIDDYSMADVGSNFQRFLKDHVDPVHGEPNGVTDYEVFKLDAEGVDIPPGLPITIQSPGNVQPPDEMERVRQAVNLISEIKGQQPDGVSPDHIMEIAKQKAAANGNMSELMILMMMADKMGNKGGGADDLLRVLQVLKPPSQPEPMMIPPPPPPPPPDTLGPIVGKLLEHSLAPKAEKSTVDTLKELAALKEIFAPPKDPEVATLRAEISSLAQSIKALAERPAAGGIADSIKQFEQVTGMVKTLAPALGMGGIGEMIKGFMTPALGNAIGNGIAFAMEKLSAKSVANTSTTPGAPAIPPPPEASKPFLEALATAKEEHEQIRALLGILQVMSTDPVWQPRLAPYLQAVFQNDVAKVSEPIVDILKTVRPDLAGNKDFVAKSVNILMQSVLQAQQGTHPPPAAQPEPPQAQPATVVQFPKAPEKTAG